MENLKNKNFIICMQEHYGGSVINLKYYENYIKNHFKYIMIYHDKESDLHFHAILINCKHSYKDLLSLFPSADIDVQRKSNKVNYLYFLHKDKKSIDENKMPYDSSLIMTNVDIDLFLQEKKSSNDDFIINELIDEILACKYSNMLDFILSNDCYKHIIMKRYFIFKDLIETSLSTIRGLLCEVDCEE